MLNKCAGCEKHSASSIRNAYWVHMRTCGSIWFAIESLLYSISNTCIIFFDMEISDYSMFILLEQLVWWLIITRMYYMYNIMLWAFEVSWTEIKTEENFTFFSPSYQTEILVLLNSQPFAVCWRWNLIWVPKKPGFQKELEPGYGFGTISCTTKKVIFRYKCFCCKRSQQLSRDESYSASGWSVQGLYWGILNDSLDHVMISTIWSVTLLQVTGPETGQEMQKQGKNK